MYEVWMYIGILFAVGGDTVKWQLIHLYTNLDVIMFEDPF